MGRRHDNDARARIAERLVEFMLVAACSGSWGACSSLARAAVSATGRRTADARLTRSGAGV
jgi:hypothetical protein